MKGKSWRREDRRREGGMEGEKKEKESEERRNEGREMKSKRDEPEKEISYIHCIWSSR